jgi:hypothetical protein
MYKFCLKRRQSDLNNFLSTLANLSLEEQQSILLGVHNIRKFFYSENNIDIMNPTQVMKETPHLPKLINSRIKKLKKDGSYYDIATYRLILFTLKADKYVETRPTVKAVWETLHKSIPSFEQLKEITHLLYEYEATAEKVDHNKVLYELSELPVYDA